MSLVACLSSGGACANVFPILMPHAQKSPRRFSRLRITLPQLTTANWNVTCEMEKLGLWHHSLDDITTYLTSVRLAYYGWFEGHIYIPSISLAVICDCISGHQISLTDVLRHEWAHALADRRPRRIDTKRFRETFGDSYESNHPVWLYHPDLHLTEYAATNPCEDFAETFHYFLKHKGRLPQRLQKKPHIVKKWNFVASLAG